MCLSTIYRLSGNQEKQLMKDVARVEAEGAGFWFIDLFGERKFIKGRIETIDLMDGRLVLAPDGENGERAD